MKKLLITLTMLLAWQFMPAQQNVWERKEVDGFFGFYNKAGKCMISPVFADADYMFLFDVAAVEPQKGKGWRLIDRKGNYVTKDVYAFWHKPNVSQWKYIIVAGDDSQYAIDYRGKAVSSEYYRIEPLYNSSSWYSGLFYNYLMGMETGYDYWAYCYKAISRDKRRVDILGAGFKPITSFSIDCDYHFISADQDYTTPLLICYYDGASRNVVNYGGEKLIAGKYTLEPARISKATFVKADGPANLYTQEELDSIWFFLGADKSQYKMKSGGGTMKMKSFDVYDITGKVIAKDVKYSRAKYTLSDVKFLRQYIVPYLQQKEANRVAVESKLIKPYRTFLAAYKAFSAKLPKKPGYAGNNMASLKKRADAERKRLAQENARKKRETAKQQAEARQQAAARQQAREEAARQSTPTQSQTSGNVYIPYNVYEGSSSTGVGQSSSAGNDKRVCVLCGGSGKCSSQGPADKSHCHGSGKCALCSGTGVMRHLGQTIVCSGCHGKKICSYCNGTGQCHLCGGLGYR